MRSKIVSAGEPALRAASRELLNDQILSPSTRNVIEYLREIVRDAPGVGRSAPMSGSPHSRQ